jgi:hypothetical protein
MGALFKPIDDMRPQRRTIGQLTGAGFAAGILSIGVAFADPPSHLDAQAAMAPGEAASRCASTLVKAGATCAVGEFGRVGAVGGRNFSFARYDFKPAPGDPYYPLAYSRIVLFEDQSPAALRAVLVSGDDAAFFYAKPVILRSTDRILLHIPAYESGTGNFNRELVYAWTKESWRDVDVGLWLDDLAHRLPKGFSVRKGVYPDYAAMRAQTPLWRAEDGENCPNGGRADIGLQWRGDRLAVRSVRIDRAGECGEASKRRGDHGHRLRLIN